MADTAIVNTTVTSAPQDYLLQGTNELLLKAVRASIDGSATTGSFVPALQLLAPDGTVMYTCISSTVVAGGSADVSWFPWGGAVSSQQTPSPNPLGTLWAWYDFSDTSTLSVDGSGNISAITDKTGNGHDLFQGTAGIRPGQTTINALNAGLFNTTAYTYLIGGPWFPTLPQPYTVIVVWTQSFAATATYLPGPFGNRTATSTGVLIQVNTGHSFCVVQATNFQGPGIVAPFTQQTMSVIVDGASSHMRISGTGDVAGSLLTPSDLTEIALGAAHVPERLPLVEGLDGAIGEVLVYTGHLSAAQLAAAEGYMRNKWNTP